MKDGKTIWIGIVAGVGAGVLCLCTVIPYLRWKIPKEMGMQRRYLHPRLACCSVAPSKCLPIPLLPFAFAFRIYCTVVVESYNAAQ